MTRVWILVALSAWAVGGCSEPRPSEGPADGFEHHTPDGFQNEEEEDVEDEIPVHFGDDLADNRQVYEQDGLEPLTLRVQIEDLAQLDYVLDNPEDRDAKVSALVQDDSFDTTSTAPNATLALRGASSRGARQKSFKLKLTDKSRPWRGHTTIHLNKHIYDHTRIRNKLSFDLFQTIPHITSLRTQFVHLFINGEDKGLFTQIENAKKSFLAAHGLDPNGTLYKVEDLDFWPIEPEVAQDPVAFNLRLESKANPNPVKFIEMLDAVNDWDRDIDDVIETYFWRDNYLAWLASNVLMANTDTNNQNFYLYSPSQSERWYFLPWDYDCAWGWTDQPGESPPPRTDKGVAHWWSPVIHKRFLMKDDNAAELDLRIGELYASQLTRAKVAERLEAYRDVVRPFISRAPDMPVLRGNMDAEDVTETVEIWSAEVDRVGAFVDRAHDDYVEGLQWPMPIWLGRLKQDGEELTFSWDESFHLLHHGLSYDFEFSHSPAFEADEIVESQMGLLETHLKVQAPAPGVYYFRVIVRDDVDPSNHWQYGHNVFEDPDDETRYHGVRQVTVW